MKYKQGFVANSSTSSFVLVNTSNEEKTYSDVILENMNTVFKDIINEEQLNINSILLDGQKHILSPRSVTHINFYDPSDEGEAFALICSTPFNSENFIGCYIET